MGVGAGCMGAKVRCYSAIGCFGAKMGANVAI